MSTTSIEVPMSIADAFLATLDPRKPALHSNESTPYTSAEHDIRVIRRSAEHDIRVIRRSAEHEVRCLAEKLRGARDLNKSKNRRADRLRGRLEAAIQDTRRAERDTDRALREMREERTHNKYLERRNSELEEHVETIARENQLLTGMITRACVLSATQTE